MNIIAHVEIPVSDLERAMRFYSTVFGVESGEVVTIHENRMERTFAWLGRCRRLAKDFEKTIASAEAWILVANLRLLTRRLARYCYPS